MNDQYNPRSVTKILTGVTTTDGAGVELTRHIGTSEVGMYDPFLLLDVFGSDQPDRYLAGFPEHPHRGFSTVTYMFAGRMRHKDNAGNSGVIETGGVQWMDAAKGIVHSEMPEQENGLLSGLQLWVNLPAEDKMKDPAYQEFTAEQISVETRECDVGVKVIAGTTSYSTAGIITKSPVEPIFLDVTLPRDALFKESIPQTHNAFIYVIDGQVNVVSGKCEDDRKVGEKSVGLLSDGNHVQISGNDIENRFLLVSGKVLNEPVSRGGPFVMNTEDEIREAFADYQAGLF